MAKYHPDLDKVRNELTTVLIKTKIVRKDLSKECTSKKQMKFKRRQQNNQEQQTPYTHALLISVLPFTSTTDLNPILVYSEYLLNILLHLINIRMTYMTDLNSSVYKMCFFFKDIFYQPTMDSIQMWKSPKEDASTTVSSLAATQQHTTTVTLNDQPLKAATATDHRQTNTEQLSDDVSGGFEDGSCTSTKYMLRPIFDRQSSRKRCAPDYDGPYDKSTLPLNSHRPVNNAVGFNSNTPMPTAQLGNTAIGSLPLAWRTANQDGYQKPSNNINIARRNQ